MSTFMTTAGPQAAVLALPVLRLAVGGILALHGYQKFVNNPGQNFAGFLANLGVPAPVVMAWVVTGLELVGGIMLIAGLLSRLLALWFVLQMLFAGIYVKMVNLGVGVIAPSDAGVTGAEVDFLLVAGSWVILLLGPGVVSLDAALGIEGRAESEPTRARTSRSTPAAPAE